LIYSLTFSSPNEADRIWHTFPQSPEEEEEEKLFNS